MKNKKLNPTLLLAMTWLMTIAAVVTLIPLAGASKPNLFGYRSLCTFAPVSTVICLIVAHTAFTLRKRQQNKGA